MSNVWDRFNGIASADEVTEAKSKFEPPIAGDYVAKLESIEPSENRDNLPMLKGQFRTLENKILFYNQNLQNVSAPQMTAVNIAEAVTFISGLLGEEITFAGMSDFAEKVKSVPVGGQYKIRVSYGKKDLEQKFPKLKVVEKIEDVPFEV